MEVSGNRDSESTFSFLVSDAANESGQPLRMFRQPEDFTTEFLKTYILSYDPPLPDGADSASLKTPEEVNRQILLVRQGYQGHQSLFSVPVVEEIVSIISITEIPQSWVWQLP
ncbi:hypothetical protein AB6A40_010772 [Gnathostoma spinigerum]|uniref:Uncharacterized protein n=1 Tax=Gnathostoma spinigerum TaxID=75299 RepID=A0ABD6EWB2_9BILA